MGASLTLQDVKPREIVRHKQQIQQLRSHLLRVRDQEARRSPTPAVHANVEARRTTEVGAAFAQHITGQHLYSTCNAGPACAAGQTRRDGGGEWGASGETANACVWLGERYVGQPPHLRPPMPSKRRPAEDDNKSTVIEALKAVAATTAVDSSANSVSPRMAFPPQAGCKSFWRDRGLPFDRKSTDERRGRSQAMQRQMGRRSGAVGTGVRQSTGLNNHREDDKAPTLCRHT